MTLFQPSSEHSRVGVLSVMPAAFTRMSTFLKLSRTFCCSDSMEEPVANIDRRPQRAAPQGLNLARNLLRLFLAAGGSHHVRSRLCNPQGDCLSQTRRTTNDNRALTCEIEPAGTQCLLHDANKVG